MEGAGGGWWVGGGVGMCVCVCVCVTPIIIITTTVITIIIITTTIITIIIITQRNRNVLADISEGTVKYNWLTLSVTGSVVENIQ